jgi:hypothetical protein
VRRSRRRRFAANFERLPQMFFAEATGEAITKLCIHDFGVFEAPRAFTLGDAGNGEHWTFPFGVTFRRNNSRLGAGRLFIKRKQSREH